MSKTIDVKSTSKEDWVALLSFLFSNGYHYHELTTIAEADEEYSFDEYSVNTFSVDTDGNHWSKEISGNGRIRVGRENYTLPQDFSKVINLVRANEVENYTPVIISDVGDYEAKVHKSGIKVGCQTISFEKFEEIAEAVKKFR